MTRAGGKARAAKLVNDAPAFDDGTIEGIDAQVAVRERGASASPNIWDVEPIDEGPGGDREAGIDPNSPRQPPRACDPKGFDVDAMNERYALVLHGSKAVIYVERPDAPIEDQQRVLTIDAFNFWHANTATETVNRATGKIKITTWSQRWIAHRRRRSFQGIEFHPDPNRVEGTPGYLNLWSGFAVKPDPTAGSCAVFKDHLLTNVCGAEKGLYTWVFGYLAHIVQKPRERTGAAIVMRGRMGAGKSIVGEVIGALFPRHFFIVDDPRYVTGQFNAHMASCLLLQADEAVWAGDKVAEGRLKGLITSPTNQIESKGVDPIRLPNYLRLIMTSNEDWVVPAGKDERRFCVLDVSPHCAQNTVYFAEMWRELRDGGLAALLHELLTFDLSQVDLRRIPRTGALLEQKIRSFSPVEAWWFDRLQAGTTTIGGREWRATIPCSTLYDDFVQHAERVGVKRKGSDTEFGIALRKLAPGVVRKKRMVDPGDGAPGLVRTWCYELPPLGEARAVMDDLLQQVVPWPPDDRDE